MNWIWGALGRGVCPSIYSLVEFTCAIGSNRLNQGLRCIKRGSGGSFWKGGANPSHRGPGGARVAPAGPTWWRQPPVARVGSPPRPACPTWWLCRSRCLESLLESSWPYWRCCCVTNKFCFYFTLESFFLALYEINPGKYRICKTHGNYQFKP